MVYAYSFLQKNLFHIRYVAKFLILLLLPYLIGKLKIAKKVEKIIKRIPKAKLSHLTCPIRSMSGSTILSYISILKGYDVHGGDDGDLPEGDLFQRDISLKITNSGFQSRFLA